MTKSKLGRKGFVYLAYISTSLFIIERNPYRSSSKTGTWRRQQVVQRPFKSVVYLTSWFIPCGTLLGLLFHRTQDHQCGDGQIPNELCPPQQSLIKKYPSGVPVAQFIDAISLLSSFLSDEYSLHQSTLT